MRAADHDRRRRLDRRRRDRPPGRHDRRPRRDRRRQRRGRGDSGGRRRRRQPLPPLTRVGGRAMRNVQIYPPIADYALLSDCHSCALVSMDGSIDWCTFHRFEARPVFGRILDWAKAGFFRIAPLDDDYEPTRRYLPGTKVLETTFRTPTGTLVLTDFFAFRDPMPGVAHPDHRLIRMARCTDGEVAV